MSFNVEALILIFLLHFYVFSSYNYAVFLTILLCKFVHFWIKLFNIYIEFLKTCLPKYLKIKFMLNNC